MADPKVTLRIVADAREAIVQVNSFAGAIEKAAGRSDSGFGAVAAAAGRVTAVVGAAAAAMLASGAALARNAINAADAFDEMSERVGVSAKELSTLAFAAERGGVGIDALEGGLTKLSRTASEAANGSAQAARGFEAIGVSVTDATGALKPTDALLKEIATRFAGYEDGAQKVALATQIFGKSGADLIPVLNQGAAGIEQLQQRARDLGLELDNTTASLAGEFNDALDDGLALVEGFGRSLGAALLPGLVELARIFVENGVEGRKAAGGAEAFADAIKTVIGVGIAGVAQIQKLGASMGAIAAQVDVFFDTIGSNFEAFQQYQKDILEIGPFDAFVKFTERGFDNVGNAIDRAGSNLDALGDQFDDIDRDAEAKIAALNSTLRETAEVTGEPGATRGAAPAMANLAAQTAAAREAAKLAADQWRQYEQFLNGAIDEMEEMDRLQSETSARFAQQERDLLTEIRLLQLSGDARQAELIRLQAEQMARDETGQVIAEQAARYGELLTELHRMEEIEALSNEAAGYFEDFAFAVLDDFGNIDDAFDNLGKSLGDMAKRYVAQMIAEFFKLQVIKPLLNSIFNIGGGSGVSALAQGASGSGFNLGSIAQMFSGGASGTGGFTWANISSLGGAGGGNMFSSALGMFTGYGQFGTAAGWSAAAANGPPAALAGSGGAGAAGGIGAIPVIGWIIAAMMANDALFGQGWRFNGGATTLPNGEQVRGGGGESWLGRIATLGAVGNADRLFRGLGFDDRTASLLSGSAIHTRLFGRKAPRVTNGETTITLGADGVGGTERYRTLEEGGLFRSDRRRWHDFGLSDDSMEAAQGLFDDLRAVMRGAAESLRGEAPDMIDAALRVVQEFDKKGKVKSTEYFVDILGRSWQEATEELAQTRLSAEAIIATIDSVLGNTVPQQIADAIVDPITDGMNTGVEEAGRIIRDRIDNLIPKDLVQVGEASAIAERWRDDAETLMEGAQFLLAVATDMRAGFDLLGTGTLTPIVDLVEELAKEGETLQGTYARLATSTMLFEDAIELMGVELDLSREAFVRFATDITDAAGGVEAAGALWSDYFQRFYTDAERASLLVSQATTRATDELADIGLALADFTGPDGLQQFRDQFEAALPTLDAQEVVQWLEAANALGYLDQAIAALAQTTVDAVDYVLKPAMEAIADAAGDVGISIGGSDGSVSVGGGSGPDPLPIIKPPVLYVPPPIVAPPPRDPISDVLDPGGVVDQIDREIEDRYQRELDWLQRLRDFQDSLLLDDQLSTLTPADMLAEARRQYEQVLAGAAAGDETARGQFDQIAREYLEQARNFFSSTDQYTSIFDRVRADIDAMIGASPATAADAVVADALATALGNSGGSASGGTTVVSSMSNLNTEFAAYRNQSREETDALVRRLERQIFLLGQLVDNSAALVDTAATGAVSNKVRTR